MAFLPMGKILLLLFLLSMGTMIFFYWLRKQRKKKMKEQMKNLREQFTGDTGPSAEPSKEDEKLLDRIIGEIKAAEKNGEKNVELALDDEVELIIEASDVLALKTPEITLHKSFPRIRLQKIEKTESGYNIKIDAEQKRKHRA